MFKPTLYFAINIFLTDLDSLSSLIAPFLYAFLIDFLPLLISEDINRISFPAKNAKRSTFFLVKFDTPFISNASVIISPLNLSSLINIFSIIFFDNVDGNIFSFSSEGTLRWAIIIADNSFLINCL